MLCQTCKDAIMYKKNPLLDENGIVFCTHHATGSSFQAAATEGCHICSVVFNRLAPSQQEYLLDVKTEDALTNIYMTGPQMIEDSPAVELFQKDSLLVVVQMDVEAKMWQLPGAKAERTDMFVLQLSEALGEYSLSIPSGDNTASAESWKLAMQWLETCTSQHSRCLDVSGPSLWYPTRLLDISESATSDVRLIISSETHPEGPYTTLSHCWGSKRSLQLTSGRLAELKQHVPLDELPQTFKDSFEITRRLGIRYIWIDSLCIMQDSKEDWLHEAALMHEVYAKSYCTIAAAASSDSSQGLFRNRTTHFLYPTEIEIPWLNSTAKYQLIDFNFWSSQILDQPLHRRGWVVQERLLAPRVLHFSSEQLVWECRELDAAEKYPRGLPKMLADSALTLFKGLDPERDGARLRKMSGQALDPKFYAYHLWSKIVQAYSSSLLTFGSDKLIALSGIAKQQKSVLEDQYIAGLWGKYLPGQLLWHVEKCQQIDGSPSVRSEQYRAPSFSWAAVDGVIRTGTFSDDGYVIDVVEVQTSPATSDVTGIIKDGFLRIRGVLKELRLQRHEIIDHYWWMTVNGTEIRSQGEDKPEWEKMGPLVHLDVDESDLSEMKYCMPVRVPSQYNTFVSGLILERTGHAEGQFRRIGIFQAIEEELHPMILARHENETQLPCESFDTSTQMHTICIV